ncbi:MAG: PepSY-associated TM helix domain-containing protein [Acidobacteriaceae bacterium]|nr:PepSY-associated TM helix domain-containing protein [Acidobacteriaceae bacterium]
MRKATAIASRWLHVYLSMVSFAVVLFFAATGLTLNHPQWFADQQRTLDSHGTLTAALLQPSHGDGADRLGIVEYLRAHDHVTGAATDFRVDDSQISVSFRAPGYTADAFIDRTTGRYDLTVVRSGFVAVLNDLHKGRDAGTVWGWLIDASAILLILVSLTGLILVWFVYKRRTSGLLLALFGAAFVLLLYKIFVP